MQANLGQIAWAPSAVSMGLGNMPKHFATPHAMIQPISPLRAMVLQQIGRAFRTRQYRRRVEKYTR